MRHGEYTHPDTGYSCVICTEKVSQLELQVGELKTALRKIAYVEYAEHDTFCERSADRWYCACDARIAVAALGPSGHIIGKPSGSSEVETLRLQFEEARKIIAEVSYSPEFKKWFYGGLEQDPCGVHAFTAKYAAGAASQAAPHLEPKAPVSENRVDEVPCALPDASGTLRCDKPKGHDGNHRGDNGLDSGEWFQS